MDVVDTEIFDLASAENDVLVGFCIGRNEVLSGAAEEISTNNWNEDDQRKTGDGVKKVETYRLPSVPIE